MCHVDNKRKLSTERRLATVIYQVPNGQVTKYACRRADTHILKKNGTESTMRNQEYVIPLNLDTAD